MHLAGKTMQAGFLSAFCPTGGKMRLYGLLGGARMYPCAKHVANKGHAGLGNFAFIRHNLVESGTFLHKHNSPFIVSLKLL